VTGGAPAGRAVALDLGSRRIGVAVSDSAGQLAFPREVLERSGDEAADLAALAAVVADVGATTVVVGLPVSLDGRDGPAARQARDEADALRPLVDCVEVVLFDERLTTVSAAAALAEAGRRGPGARRAVDSAAATVLLQAWLDAGRPVR